MHLHSTSPSLRLLRSSLVPSSLSRARIRLKIFISASASNPIAVNALPVKSINWSLGKFLLLERAIAPLSVTLLFLRSRVSRFSRAFASAKYPSPSSPIWYSDNTSVVKFWKLVESATCLPPWGPISFQDNLKDLRFGSLVDSAKYFRPSSPILFLYSLLLDDNWRRYLTWLFGRTI